MLESNLASQTLSVPQRRSLSVRARGADAKSNRYWNGKGLACKISMRRSVGGLRKAARWASVLTVLVHGRPGSNNLMKSVRLRLNLRAVTGYTAISQEQGYYLIKNFT